VLTLPRGDPRLTPPKWAGLALAIPLMSGTPGLVIAGAVAAFLLGWFVMVSVPRKCGKLPLRLLIRRHP